MSLRVWSTKMLSPWTIFMAIFELSMVDYPRNRLIFINSTIFTKYYVYVLTFLSEMVLVKSLRLLEHTRYDSTVTTIAWPKVLSTKVPFGFSLISRFFTLITPN